MKKVKDISKTSTQNFLSYPTYKTREEFLKSISENKSFVIEEKIEDSKLTLQRIKLFSEFENALYKAENAIISYGDDSYSVSENSFSVVWFENEKRNYLKDFCGFLATQKENCDVEVTVEVPEILFTITRKYIHIRLKVHKKLKYSKEKGVFETSFSCSVRNFSLSSAENIWVMSEKKMYPATLKSFSKLNNPQMDCAVGILLKKWIKSNVIWRDIAENGNELCSPNRALPPIAIAKIFEFHNKHQLLQSKFKNVNVPKSVNKAEFGNAYYVVGALKFCAENERQKLYALMDDQNLCTKISEAKYEKERPKAVIRQFFDKCFAKTDTEKEKNILSDYSVETFFDDYFNMCCLEKQPVSLRIKTRRELKNQHDLMAEKVTKRKHKSRKYAVRIRKNSVFNFLKFPKEFERIKTRSRLDREGIEQHNCVSTYGDSINKDRCAIYSVLFENKRYTLEIRKEEKRFVLRQIHGFANSKCPKELSDKVREHLKTSNKETKKSTQDEYN